jgi:hypothetical protein
MYITQSPAEKRRATFFDFPESVNAHPARGDPTKSADSCA